MSIEPRPTEFHGVRYRSKSEALVAYCLAYMGCRFQYEPRGLKVGHYTPDFLAWVQTPACPGRDVFGLWVIEYKPAQPTQTYLDELAGHFAELNTRFPAMLRPTFKLLCGSFYESDELRELCFFPGIGFVDNGDGVFNTPAMRKSARKFRFDLEAVPQ